MNSAAMRKAIFAVFMSIFMALSPLGFPQIPHAKDFELVWADEFDGNDLDAAKWKGLGCDSGDPSVRRGSYWHTDMATVKDGKLHIQTEYYPDGFNGNGKPGWYTCGITTKGLYAQKYGYFEVRCILPKGPGLWSAFWMGSIGPDGSDGTEGAELDIFEAPYYASKYPRRVSSNIHYGGYGEHLHSTNICEPYMLFNNP